MANKEGMLILFSGPSGVGKDTVLDVVLNKDKSLQKSISLTTRDIRDNEIDGKDYFFLDNFQFAQKVLDGSMLEATSFRAWMYGTPLDSLDKDKINIGVFNPTSIRSLLKNGECDVFVAYVRTDDKERLLR